MRGNALSRANIRWSSRWRPIRPAATARGAGPIPFSTGSRPTAWAAFGSCGKRSAGRSRRGGAALAAITATPAKLLGLDARLGTIAVGRDADLVALSGDHLI